MKILYQIRAWICRAFMQLELPIKIIAKFGAVFLILERISAWDGFQSGLPFNSAAVHMILALLCVLLPMRFATFFAIIIIIYNIYQASFWGAIIAAVLLVVLYILISRLAPDETVLMILMPLLLKTNILIVPLFAGAFMGVFSIIPIVGGIVLWGFMRILPVFLKFDAGAIDELPELMTETFSYIGDQFIKNKELLFLMILCAGIVVVVWLLNKVNFNYMRYLAVIAGAAVGFVCLVVGRTTGMVDISVVDTVKMPVLAALVMIFVEFFHIALNYKMSRRLEFADDEYYYYVKAIPKILALSRKTEIKTITDSRTQMLPSSEAIHAETVKSDESIKETAREVVRGSSAKQAPAAQSAKPAAKPAAEPIREEKPVEKPRFIREPETVAAQAETEAAEQVKEQTAEQAKEQKPALDLTGVKTFFAGLGSKAKKGFESAKGFVTDKVAEIRKPKDEAGAAANEYAAADAEATTDAKTTADADATADTDAVKPESSDYPAASGEVENPLDPDDIFGSLFDDEEEPQTASGADPEAAEEAGIPEEADESTEGEADVTGTQAEETAAEGDGSAAEERRQEQSLSDMIPEEIRSGESIDALKKDTGWTDETIRLFFDGLDDDNGKSGK